MSKSFSFPFETNLHLLDGHACADCCGRAQQSALEFFADGSSSAGLTDDQILVIDAYKTNLQQTIMSKHHALAAALGVEPNEAIGRTMQALHGVLINVVDDLVDHNDPLLRGVFLAQWYTLAAMASVGSTGMIADNAADGDPTRQRAVRQATAQAVIAVHSPIEVQTAVAHLHAAVEAPDPTAPVTGAGVGEVTMFGENAGLLSYPKGYTPSAEEVVDQMLAAMPSLAGNVSRADLLAAVGEHVKAAISNDQ